MIAWGWLIVAFLVGGTAGVMGSALTIGASQPEQPVPEPAPEPEPYEIPEDQT